MLNDLLAKNQSSDKLYVEDVFSTWLYSGTGSSQTITTGIDLSANAGMVWIKGRSGATDHAIYDTARGVQKDLVTNATSAETTQSTGLTAFSSTGFTIGALAKLNTSAATYASWTFRKALKFFDVVTWSGNSTNRTISHSLGSVPGMIIVKRTDTTADWQVYHRSLANTEYAVLNTTAAKATGTTRWNSTTATDTVFSLGTDSTVNATGGSYVAYLFAHDAGGFGADGSQNVISCGSFTKTSAVNSINLGYEPQFVIVKRTDAAQNWWQFDTMRGASLTSSLGLNASTSSAETDFGADGIYPTATGFDIGGGFGTSGSYIYLAIRRGPMRVPTDATKVFNVSQTTSSTSNYNVGFPTDAAIFGLQSGGAEAHPIVNRLTGSPNFLSTSQTSAENTAYAANSFVFDLQNSFNQSAFLPVVRYHFRRAPGFFDVVCYTGNSSTQTITHNLSAVPELMFLKSRSNGAEIWQVYSAAIGNTKRLVLNTNAAASSASSLWWNNTTPTSTTFTLGANGAVNTSGDTEVAYLFASCPGVSKVGTYTGTGTTKQIDCGFTNGARFVLIKRTDSTGDWYVYDSARGIVAGNDPYLLLNSTAAEVTNTDYVDAYSAGFELSSTAPAALNASGGTYIYLAIA